MKIRRGAIGLLTWGSQGERAVVRDLEREEAQRLGMALGLVGPLRRSDQLFVIIRPESKFSPRPSSSRGHASSAHLRRFVDLPCTRQERPLRSANVEMKLRTHHLVPAIGVAHGNDAL